MNDFSEASTSARQICERKKSNLAFAFFCLDKERVKDMEIFYAFCRLMDDIADEEGQSLEDKRRDLENWKVEIEKIYANKKKLSPLAEEMADVIARRNIPKEYLIAIIDGCIHDTYDTPYETFEDVRKYCYCVASAVGLASIYIFGFKNPRTKKYAEALGYALQFTNILRDVAEDMATRGRCYIPSKELEFFGVKKEDLLEPSKNPQCKKLFAMLRYRAKHYFNMADRLLPEEDAESMKPSFIMRYIYEEILDRLACSDYNAIKKEPLKLSKAQKIKLAFKALRNGAKRAAKKQNFGKVCVLGGGVAGICSAVKLAEEGFDVELIEARANLGGRAATINWQDARLDNGSHATMGCYENFFGFTKSLETEIDNVFVRANGMDFTFPDGKTFSTKYPTKDASTLSRLMSFLSYARIPQAGSWRNMLLLLKIKFGLAKPNVDETTYNFLLRKGLTQAELDAFWEPFCVSALNTSIKSASATLTIDTLKKSILKSGESGILYFPSNAVIDALLPNAIKYLESVGAKIRLSETIKEIRIENGKFVGIGTNKNEFEFFDKCVCALPPKAVAQLLPKESKISKSASKMKSADIANIYFTTYKKLFDSPYACLIGSPLHWIFDHSHKLPKDTTNKYLYGITISAASEALDKSSAETLIKSEISKIFGSVNIIDILPSFFKDATISADIETEKARIADKNSDIENLHICGDWIASDLPCTLESAAKSVNNLEIFR